MRSPGNAVVLADESKEYLGAGERVVVLLRQMGRPKSGDTEYDVPEVHVWTVRDGKIVDFEGLFDTATVLRTLQLQPRGYVRRAGP